MQRFVMRSSCRNRPGIVAALSGSLFEGGFNIVDSRQFDDPHNGDFFMRIVFDREAPASDDDVAALLDPARRAFDMNIHVRPTKRYHRVLIMASRFDHCLVDLLYRWRIGELKGDVVGIVSNHPRDTYAHLDFGALPFYHLPVTRDTKAEQEARLLEVIEETGADLVVLARYMQVLSDDLSRALAGRCINIHHSFLPGFKGAKPYHQAYERGVKMIGATAHYVTADLDEGPIIHQDVERVSHADTPDDLIRKGRDIERRVLAEAVRLHLEDRVFVSGARTVVFRN